MYLGKVFVENVMNDKILSVAIPCYNSQDYMEKAVLSALSGGDTVEVLIVNDGSTDDTEQIGKRLEQEYPGQVKYIYKENGGHGDAVMTGLSHATGFYFKVLDSDDWFDKGVIKEVVKRLSILHESNQDQDMFLCNYVYDKAGEKRKVAISYKGVLPEDTSFTWDDIGRFQYGQYILMHSVIYRRQLLLDCGLQLPKHTFYVDNIYVYYPLPYVEKMYYMNVDLYRYYIGREDQSVNEAIMIRRIDQQLLVTRLMLGMHDLSTMTNKKLQHYMSQYLTIMVTVSSVLLIKDGSKESLDKKRLLWKDLKEQYPEHYRLIDKQLLGKIIKNDSKPWNWFIKTGYSIAQKIYHFN